MTAIGTPLIGRLGNQLFQYAYAKKMAEIQCRELHTQPWSGQLMFEINDPPIDGSEEMLPENYHQDQASLIYTREDCKRWFKFRPEFVEAQGKFAYQVAAHYRGGDYFDLGYPVVTKKAIRKAVESVGFDFEPGLIEENSGRSPLEDFYLMTRAQVLFRANSSYSWWAATLCDGRVFAPCIDGLGGGEHDDVKFIEGNWPRLANFEFTANLRLS